MRRLLAALAGLALGCSGIVREGAPAEAEGPPADRIFLGDVLTIDANNSAPQNLMILNSFVMTDLLLTMAMVYLRLHTRSTTHR